MSGRARAGCAGSGALAALVLAACTTATVGSDEPRTVIGQPLPPYEFHEECMRLARGDRVDYTFAASEPVAFDLRHYTGNAVVSPVTRDATLGDAGVFAPALAGDYCLRWEAGPAGARLDYRISMRRAGP